MKPALKFQTIVLKITSNVIFNIKKSKSEEKGQCSVLCTKKGDAYVL